MQQLGKAIGIVAANKAAEHWLITESEGYNVCRDGLELAVKGAQARARQARRHAKAVSGLSRRAFNVELARVRNSRAWGHYVDRIYCNHYPC